MENKILVITATLGNRPSLRETVESVKQIGGEDVKHIIVAPQARIEALSKEYGVECLAELPDKKGIYAALNHGFRTFGHDYKYMTFINDDDHWLPDYRKLIDTILQDHSLDLVYGRTRYVNDGGQTIGTQTCSGRFRSFVSLFKQGIIMLTQQATIIKSDVYFRIGGFDESYKLVADTKFWIQLSQQPQLRFRYINKECAAYMIQEGQLSSDKSTQSAEDGRLRDEVANVRSSALDAYLFRLSNAPIYLRRICNNRSGKNPFASAPTNASC
jgi:glycosyltransferase involved in cell wall biosynthesis